MAGLPFKKGLVPMQSGVANPWTGGFEVFQTSVGSGAIYHGDPVFLTANGFVIAPTSVNFPTSTTNCIGVAVGAFWVDPTSKQPVESRHKPANVSSAAGVYNGLNFKTLAGPGIKVITDRNVVYACKANNSVGIAKLGDRVELEVSAGSALTGQSGCRASITGGVVDIFRITGVLKATELADVSTIPAGPLVNDWGAKETVVLGKLRNYNETL